jgi:HD-GYP domain-containing protein (c-di-GMP phosphodiesterase class II)
VLCIVFGRHLGFDELELHNLALGGLLLDMGKTTVPVPILAKPGHLNSSERSFVNRHVPDGLSMIRFNDDVMERVIDMISAHHERIDGSGYPHKMSGTEIPLFARIAGIVDTFDALTLNRHYASARSGHSALRFIDALRDIKFDAALVDEFIRAVGVYPTGTCVELADGSVGLVCGQNAALPRTPNVLLTTDSAGQALKTMRILEPGHNVQIARALPATSLASDPRFRQQ